MEDRDFAWGGGPEGGPDHQEEDDGHGKVGQFPDQEGDADPLDCDVRHSGRIASLDEDFRQEDKG